MSNKDFNQGIVTELEKAAAEYAANGNQQNSEYTVEMKKASFKAGYRYAINLLKRNNTYDNTEDTQEGHMPVGNPVRAFLDDILLGASWNMLPYEILHSLYGEYTVRNNLQGAMMGRARFICEVRDCIEKDGWSCPSKPVRTGN